MKRFGIAGRMAPRGRLRAGACAALFLALSGADLASIRAGLAQEVKAQAPSGAAAGPSASRRLGIARLRGAWWIGRGVREHVFKDFDPNAIPVLMVERREGREGWALLMNHPAPPDGFTLAEEVGAEGPAVFAGKAPPLPPGAFSPFPLAGAPTALFIVGETLPDGPLGSEPAERILPRLIHEMVHVYALSRGTPPGLAPASALTYPDIPEVMALAAVENRILMEFLNADLTKTLYLEDLARQFIAVRRTRWALAGESAGSERRLELAEAPAIYAESQALRILGQRLIEPPPLQGADPAYHSFQYPLLWRLTFLQDRLAGMPSNPSHLAARIPYAAAAQALMLERLNAPDWLTRVFKADTALIDLLAERVPLDAAQQEEAFSRARTAFDYEPALALARERAPASPHR